jgi:hypothetical protein
MAHARTVLDLAWSTGAASSVACGGDGGPLVAAPLSDPVAASSPAALDVQGRAQLASGRQIFPFDTFGDETFWGRTLRLQPVNPAGPGDAKPRPRRTPRFRLG